MDYGDAEMANEALPFWNSNEASSGILASRRVSIGFRLTCPEGGRYVTCGLAVAEHLRSLKPEIHKLSFRAHGQGYSPGGDFAEDILSHFESSFDMFDRMTIADMVSF